MFGLFRPLNIADILCMIPSWQWYRLKDVVYQGGLLLKVYSNMSYAYLDTCTYSDVTYTIVLMKLIQLDLG